MLVERESPLGAQATAKGKGKAPNCSFHFTRNASPQLRHEIWSRSARAALPPFLGFPWILSCETRLINGLHGIKHGNFFLSPSLALGAPERSPSALGMRKHDWS